MSEVTEKDEAGTKPYSQVAHTRRRFRGSGHTAEKPVSGKTTYQDLAGA